MSSKEVDELYEKLSKDGKATIDNLVKWMKDAKVLERANQTEEEVKKMFTDVNKQNDVSLETFKKVFQKLATKAKTTTQEMAKQMLEARSRFISAVKAFSSTLMGEQQPDTSKKIQDKETKK